MKAWYSEDGVSLSVSDGKHIITKMIPTCSDSDWRSYKIASMIRDSIRDIADLETGDPFAYEQKLGNMLHQAVDSLLQ